MTWRKHLEIRKCKLSQSKMIQNKPASPSIAMPFLFEDFLNIFLPNTSCRETSPLVGPFVPSTGKSCSLHWMYRLGTVAQWHWRSETCSRCSLSNAFWATRSVGPFKLFPASYSFQCFASSVCLQAYAVDTSYGAWNLSFCWCLFCT